MKKILCPLVVIGTLVLGCNSHKENTSLKNPLFVYDFNLGHIEIYERLKMLKSIGFDGVVLGFNPEDKNTLNYIKDYQNAIDSLRLALPIKAVFFWADFNSELSDSVWKDLIITLRKDKIYPWPIIGGDRKKIDSSVVVKNMQKMADFAAQNQLNLIIYPHDGAIIASAEEAIPFIKLSNKKNIKVSLHLCHELRAGNAKRLKKVIKNILPYWELGSLSGADTVYYKDRADWSDGIRPLAKTVFDVENFVKEVRSAGYSGPMVLHTYGINDSVPQHLINSFKIWKKY